MARHVSDITEALIKAGWVSQYAHAWGIPIDFISCSWDVYKKYGISITVYNDLNTVQICSRSNKDFSYIVPWDDISELALSKGFKSEEQFIMGFNRLEVKRLLENM